MKAAAIDTAAADLVDWLAEDKEITDRIQAIGDTLADGAIEDLRGSLGANELKNFKTASLNHFWCELLGSLACVLDQIRGWRNQVRDQLKEVMLASNASTLIEDDTVSLAVDAAWAAIPHALLFPQLNQIDHIIWPVRTLAILMCKAPERHKTVSKCCLDPIAAGANQVVKAAVADLTKKRLIQALPSDWPPETRKKLSE
ncbi:hypothetical protein [Actinoallomurus acaciae]|uniref:Uncharacterized protein n=1 Tax=Actinoallomurus acaciae TaxID=502577 RepID=A0ABV5YA36_9ACTN